MKKMKYIYTFILAFSISNLDAQVMTFSLVKVDQENIVSVIAKPVGGDITSSLQQFDMFIRIPDSPTSTVRVRKNNDANFPDLEANPVAYVGADQFGTETGFINLRFMKPATTSGDIDATYINDTVYEVFQFEFIDGMPDEIIDVEIAANSDEDPYFLVASGSAGDWLDPLYYDADPTANLFFGITNTTAGSSSGQSYFTKVEDVALPIKIKSFTAVPFENRDANLDWVTASEVNGSHFDVERSDDGVNFAHIGRVEATGNSNTDQDYKFSDREVGMERNDVVQYYRIKMVDIDGEYKYSGIRAVNFTRADYDFMINIFPNPTANYVQLELTGLENASTERPMLNVYSNTGELIRAEVLNSDLGKIDISNLPSSSYHFIIDYKGQRYMEEIILIK